MTQTIKPYNIKPLTYTPAMRTYKIHAMISSSVSSTAVKKIITQIDEIIKKTNGKITESTEPKLIELKTAIDKQMSAWYVFIQTSIIADQLHEIRFNLSLITELVRYIILAINKNTITTAINFDPVNEKDYRNRNSAFWTESLIVERPKLLEFFISANGRIMPRTICQAIFGTKKSASKMKQLSVSVKQARFMGLLPLKPLYSLNINIAE